MDPAPQRRGFFFIQSVPLPGERPLHFAKPPLHLRLSSAILLAAGPGESIRRDITQITGYEMVTEFIQSVGTSSAK